MRRSQVNRYLRDKNMDHIDHALGRPVDPLNEEHSYRNHFATSADDEKAYFRSSPYWFEGGTMDRMTWFHVSDEGRQALADHLKEIGDPHRLFEVDYAPRPGEAYSTLICATSRGSAKYLYWLDVSDAWTDLKFGDFCRHASARLAR